MLEQIASYLEKLGYTAEQQGSIEKYLVVTLKGQPLGFILSDGSVHLVTGMEGADVIRDIVTFITKNQNLPSAGKSEFRIAEFRRNQLTTFYDCRDRITRYSVYLLNESTGEVEATVFESYDDAVYRFITGTRMIDLKKYLPKKENFRDRMRARLIRRLTAKSNGLAERL